MVIVFPDVSDIAGFFRIDPAKRFTFDGDAFVLCDLNLFRADLLGLTFPDPEVGAKSGDFQLMGGPVGFPSEYMDDRAAGRI